MKPHSVQSLLILSFAALCGCAGLRPPKAYDPPAPGSEPADKGAEYCAHAVTQAGMLGYQVDGQDHVGGSLSTYMIRSGDPEDGRAARWASLASIVGVLAWAVGPLTSNYQHPGWMAGGVAAAGLSLALDELYTLPQRQSAAEGFNRYLAHDLGLTLTAQLSAPTPPAGGLWGDVEGGSRGMWNSDQKDYYGAPAWEDRLYGESRSALGIGWRAANGLGLELVYETVRRSWWASWLSGARQTQDLAAGSLLLRPSYGLLLLPGTRANLSLGWDLGWSRLSGNNHYNAPDGSVLGDEALSADAFCHGPRLQVRRPYNPWVDLGFDVGYRWCRFDAVRSDGAWGTLNAAPGRTYGGAPQVWDFSGPQFGLVIGFGWVPYGQR